MTRLPSGESRGGEPEPNPLGLGFAESGVGEGGSALWYGVVGQSLWYPLLGVPPPVIPFHVLLLQRFSLVRPP
jgi:hypothetical protein